MARYQPRQCAYCGNGLREGAGFCSACGCPVPEPAPPVQPQGKKRLLLVAVVLLLVLLVLLAAVLVILFAQQNAAQSGSGALTASDAAQSRAADAVELQCAGRWTLDSVFHKDYQVLTQIRPGSLNLTLLNDHSGSLEYDGGRSTVVWQHTAADDLLDNDGSIVYVLALQADGTDAHLLYRASTEELLLQTGVYVLTFRRG